MALFVLGLSITAVPVVARLVGFMLERTIIKRFNATPMLGSFAELEHSIVREGVEVGGTP